MNKFCFIADCTQKSGKGHLSRCLVLAQALRETGANCRFFVTSPYGVRQALGFEAAHLSTLDCIDEETVIVDGYGFTSEQLVKWRDQAARLVLIDDLAERPFAADLVINHNLYGDRLDYADYGAKAVLAGPRFAMIKPEFAALRRVMPAHDGHILISFGGSNLSALGLELAQLLAPRFTQMIDVVIPAFAIPDNFAPAKTIVLHSDADLASLMGRAQIFIGALGVSYLEALAAGVKTVGVKIADNQLYAFAAAKDLGLSVLEDVDMTKLTGLCTTCLKDKGGALPLASVDGQGAARLARYLTNDQPPTTA